MEKNHASCPCLIFFFKNLTVNCLICWTPIKYASWLLDQIVPPVKPWCRFDQTNIAPMLLVPKPVTLSIFFEVFFLNVLPHRWLSLESLHESFTPSTFVFVSHRFLWFQVWFSKRHPGVSLNLSVRRKQRFQMNFLLPVLVSPFKVLSLGTFFGSLRLVPLLLLLFCFRGFRKQVSFCYLVILLHLQHSSYKSDGILFYLCISEQTRKK